MDKVFSYESLRSFTISVLECMGCPPEEARLGTEVLLSADLRGIDSHGVARLSGYVRLWEARRINPTPDIKVVHETPSTAVVDGDAGNQSKKFFPVDLLRHVILERFHYVVDN